MCPKMWAKTCSRSLTFASQFIAPLDTLQRPFASVAYDSHFLVARRKLITVQALRNTQLRRLASCFGIRDGLRCRRACRPIVIDGVRVAGRARAWATHARCIREAGRRCRCRRLGHGKLCQRIHLVPCARQIRFHSANLRNNAAVILAVWDKAITRVMWQRRERDENGELRLYVKRTLDFWILFVWMDGRCTSVRFAISIGIKFTPDVFASFVSSSRRLYHTIKSSSSIFCVLFHCDFAHQAYSNYVAKLINHFHTVSKSGK